ncbi:hypothetical protein QN372_21185 [Undibacterium sp. RTI2.1]|uniref:hypothetical protein n=1 Tax=unclassified Undibacterium TaxID=2630295 RepID=UPI002B22D081|nr:MULTISPECIES: hypothetical protein [unclassified Undibacterium]MEB0033249.1 hypothetical protein [Undibacterium sp. RTI2.1]MEB0118735.1 hypothetical protein [Undibacterium sp. RTI2.2]
MFSTAKNELRELMLLVRELAVYDTTLATNSAITPSDERRADRRLKELRMIHLQTKYELI